MRIQSKLFLTILATSGLVLMLMFVSMSLSINLGAETYSEARKLDSYKLIGQQLTEKYSEQNNWQFLKAKPRFGRSIEGRVFNRGSRHNTNVVLLDSQNKRLLGNYRKSRDYLKIPLVVEDTTIGWLLYSKGNTQLTRLENNFLKGQINNLVLIGLVMLLLATLAAFLLSRHFVRPIKEIAAGATALAQGDYSIELSAQRRDELGELARDFNELAKVMSDNDSMRKRWLADTSHELRTPIAVLKAELEAMLDGIRPLNTENLQAANDSLNDLCILIDDLYELSNADIGALRYRKEVVDLSALVSDCLQNHKGQLVQAGLDINWQASASPIEVWGDAQRLKQLLGNLLHNSCKYTEAPGQLSLQLSQQEKTWLLTIEDSAPAVPTNSYAQLFDYLYRVEDSRNRQTGGTGLGLAICQRIAQAHAGEITAEPSVLGGIKISLSLPILEAE